ncbi:MAG TPA: M20/M25/M40 family metallo-hydrolase, partial [Solirubrobacteraceae bacterium]
CRMLSMDPERPNLIARVAGSGDGPPLLLYGHVDVVPAVASEWTHPPFGAEIADGCVWGRGALDMKGGVAMMVAAVTAVATSGEPPPSDVVLMLTSDEEAGSHCGMGFLVHAHPEQFAGMEHAISEVGGMTMWAGDRAVVPVQVAEKQRCVIRGRLRGPGGHAAAGVQGTASGRLGRLLAALDGQRLPVHVTDLVRDVVGALAPAVPSGMRPHLARLLVDGETDDALVALGQFGATLQPLLRNTATPTGLGGGVASNVVPTELYVDLDARVVPGCTPEHLLAELEALAPGLATYELRQVEPPADTPDDLALLGLLSDVLAHHEPDAVVVPWVLAGYTDARYVSQLGIQTYGFLPMRLPRDITPALMHAPDERVPVDGLELGVDCLIDVIGRYGEACGARHNDAQD